MSYNTLGRLRTASYKGITVLVRSSALTFGQKTVVHDYPNANRTEVQYLGIRQDQFEVELFVYGAGIIEKRKRLKEALSERKHGRFVHPFDGDLYVAVVGQARLDDDFGKLGMTRFVVTFQVVDNQSYPNVSTGFSLATIASAVNAVVNTVESTFDDMTMIFSPSVLANKTGLSELMDSFDNSIRFTYKLADKATELNEGILDFKRKINSYAQAPSALKTAFTSLFNTINFVATDNKQQIGVLDTFTDFGSTNQVIIENTLERKERAKNQRIITNAVHTNALALMYGTLSQIDYDNMNDLDTYRNKVEAIYNNIKEELDDDVLENLETLRNQTLQYLEQLNIVDVRDITTQPTSLMLLGFTSYGTITKYDDLFKLNLPENPTFIEGEVQVLDE